MQITVSGKQVDLSDALRTRVADNLDLIAGKYFDHALEANVTFSRARNFFLCDINLHAGRGLILRGEGEAADAHGAFDDAAEHIAKRLRRYRRRVNDHARDAAQRQRPDDAATLPATENVASVDAPTLEADAPRVPDLSFATVVAESPAKLARLSVSEAVLQLDLVERTVLMFHNSATGGLNVVYRRADGNIGWIDPAAT